MKSIFCHNCNGAGKIRGTFLQHTCLRCSGTGYEKPKIVCLCGSTKFYKEFQNQSLILTKKRIIVLSIDCATTSDKKHNISQEEREIFNELHLRKIDLADEVFVINCNGYIGKDTQREIDYAIKIGKIVKYLVNKPEKNKDAN